MPQYWTHLFSPISEEFTAGLGFGASHRRRNSKVRKLDMARQHIRNTSSSNPAGLNHLTKVPPQLKLHQQPAVVAHETTTSPSSEASRISSIPGFKTSAAFLSSLSANLRLPDADSDIGPSPVSTPNSLRASHPDISTLPSPLPSTLAMASEQPTDVILEEKSDAVADAPNPNSDNPLEGVPDLSTYVATDPDERTAALKLIADSVAQQRAFASQILIFHPALIGLWVLFTAVFIQYKYKTLGDLPLIVTTMSGVTMSCFVAVRYVTGRYIFMAEEVNWKWLGDDDLVVSKYGDQVIGALALGWDGKEDKKGRKMKGGYGLVRAWTVRLKYRGKSIGQSLLEEAVEETVKRGGEGIEFAEDHLYSERVLWKQFNRGFDKRDARAEKALQHVIEAKGAFAKKR